MKSAKGMVLATTVGGLGFDAAGAGGLVSAEFAAAIVDGGTGTGATGA